MPPIVPPYTDAQKRVTTSVQLTFGLDDPEDELPVDIEIVPDDVSEAD